MESKDIGLRSRFKRTLDYIRSEVYLGKEFRISRRSIQKCFEKFPLEDGGFYTFSTTTQKGRKVEIHVWKRGDKFSVEVELFYQLDGEQKSTHTLYDYKTTDAVFDYLDIKEYKRLTLVSIGKKGDREFPTPVY